MKSSIEGQITITQYLASIQQDSKAAPPEPAPARRPVRRPALRHATQAGLPELSPAIRKLLRSGAGRPGARIRIERAILEHPGMAYEPVKVAADELVGVDADGVKIYRRGVFDEAAGWFTWYRVTGWIGEQIKAGAWLTPAERRQEEAADAERKSVRKGWKL